MTRNESRPPSAKLLPHGFSISSPSGVRPWNDRVQHPVDARVFSLECPHKPRNRTGAPQCNIEMRATENLDFGLLKVLQPCDLGDVEIARTLVIGAFPAKTDQTRSDRDSSADNREILSRGLSPAYCAGGRSTSPWPSWRLSAMWRPTPTFDT